MKREITNAIRYVMDEWIPSVIRDSKWFMYPAYYYWFKGKYISELMQFQKNVYKMTHDEYAEFYGKLEIRAKERPTDMNQASIELILSELDQDATTLLDVGCGRGYFLDVLSKKTKYLLTGCDMHNTLSKEMNAHFVNGYIEELPFPDNAFDIVTCSHVIEHIINIKQALAELKRVARKQLVIVTPCQKYYFHTLDLHVNFFPIEEKLTHLIGLNDFFISNVKGDWVYSGKISN